MVLPIIAAAAPAIVSAVTAAAPEIIKTAAPKASEGIMGDKTSKEKDKPSPQANMTAELLSQALATSQSIK